MRRKKPAVLPALALVLLLACLLPVTALAAEGLPAGFAGMASVNLEVNEGFAWRPLAEGDSFSGLTYDADHPIYLAGNSGSGAASVSNLAITVAGTGQLTFNYWVSSATMGNYFLSWRLNTPFASTENRADQPVQCNGVASGTVSISIAESDLQDGTATVYIAYVRGSTGGTGSETYGNYAAVSDVTFTTGSRPDLVQYNNKDAGTVSAWLITTENDPYAGTITTETAMDLSAAKIGQTVKLSAAPNVGYEFYGWIRHYKSSSGKDLLAFEGTAEITFSVGEYTWYEPIFAEKGAYTMRRGCTFYTAADRLQTVLDGATNGETVVLLQSMAVSEDLTVKSGVTLYVPFRPDWLEQESTGAYHILGDGGCTGISEDSKAYVTLTVEYGATLTVNGTLCSGAVMGSSTISGFQGQTSGAFGKIVCDGSIVVGSKGKFTTWGITSGAGTVLAKDGGTVEEPFIVGDFTGGSNTYELFGKQMPFKRYAMQNIQCTLELERGGTLAGLCGLYALGGINETTIGVVGTQGALFLPNETAAEGSVILTRTYDPGRALTSGGAGTAGVGTTTWNISGGLTFQVMTLDVGGLTITTDGTDFPIPYNMKLILSRGTYNIPGGLRIMPGASLEIRADAKLNLTGRLLVMDGLVQGAMSGKSYPSSETLQKNKMSPSGELILNGTLSVEAGATLGGIVQTTGETGLLIVSEGAYLNNSGGLDALDPGIELEKQTGYKANDWVQQDGGLAWYSDNTSWFNLPARICLKTTDDNGTETCALTQVTPGVYRAAGTYDFKLDSYTMSYCYNGGKIRDGEGNKVGDYWTARVMQLETVAINQPMTGAWVNNTAELTWTEQTYLASDSQMKVVVTAETTSDGQYSLSICCENKDGSPVTQTYVHLVTYQTADGETMYERLRGDGSCLLSADARNVTVETALLGDLSFDGVVSAADATICLKASVGLLSPNELQNLSGDVYEDGQLSAADASKILKISVGLSI